MPKDLLNAADSFGEGFLSTLQSEREKKQKEQEFQQKMGLEMRQQKFTNIYRDALIKNMDFDNRLKKSEAESKILSGYVEVPPGSPLPRGATKSETGEDLNKQHGSGGLLKPFEEGKFYSVNPEQEKQQAGIDLWEDINPNAIDPTTKKPAKLMRNKQTGEERYVENYREPKTSSSRDGSNEKTSEGDKLTNQYEITAFSNLRNSGTGKEDEEYTPQMKDRDFKIVGNALLTPELFTMVDGLRKGTGDYPTVDEIIDTFKSANLQGKAKKSAENFIKYYSQIETTLAPVKTIDKWLK